MEPAPERVVIVIHTTVIDVKNYHVLFDGSRERIFLDDFIDWKAGDRVKITFTKEPPCAPSTPTISTE